MYAITQKVKFLVKSQKQDKHKNYQAKSAFYATTISKRNPSIIIINRKIRANLITI